jgi:hypothetical protein
MGATKSPGAPITVPKPKWRPKTPSTWVEEEIIHDPDFDYVCQDRTGYSLRKHKPQHLPAPDLNFHCVYNESKDRDELVRNLVFENDLDNNIKRRVVRFLLFTDITRTAALRLLIVQSSRFFRLTKQLSQRFIGKPIYMLSFLNFLSISRLALTTT